MTQVPAHRHFNQAAHDEAVASMALGMPRFLASSSQEDLISFVKLRTAFAPKEENRWLAIGALSVMAYSHAPVVLESALSVETDEYFPDPDESIARLMVREIKAADHRMLITPYLPALEAHLDALDRSAR